VIKLTTLDGACHLRLRPLDQLAVPDAQDLVPVRTPALIRCRAVELIEFDLAPVVLDGPLDVFGACVRLEDLADDGRQLTGQLTSGLIVLAIATVQVLCGVDTELDALFGVSYTNLDTDRVVEDGPVTIHFVLGLDLLEGERYLPESEDAGDVEVRSGTALPECDAENLSDASLVGSARDELDVSLEDTEHDHEHGNRERGSEETKFLVRVRVEKITLREQRCCLYGHDAHLLR